MASARVIVLAAQRAGVVDPLAEQFGVSHKCLVPVAGQPLIAHVLRTTGQHPAVGDVIISVEPNLFDSLNAIAAELPGVCEIRCVGSTNNLADSVIRAAEGAEGPVVITTADNALLTNDALKAMIEALDGGADVALAMATETAVRSAHPDGQRRFYRFADQSYSNCNLYGLAMPRALAAAEIFRGGGQFAKKAQRIIDAFGLFNLLLLRLRLVSLKGGLARISRRIGLDIAPVILADGRNAIDVDNSRTHAVVTQLIGRAA
jgi:GTP:adenosylcobinamide-phosphate guanylyltransferase